jgi:hypothetical protein
VVIFVANFKVLPEEKQDFLHGPEKYSREVNL